MLLNQPQSKLGQTSANRTFTYDFIRKVLLLAIYRKHSANRLPLVKCNDIKMVKLQGCSSLGGPHAANQQQQKKGMN